MIDRFSLLHRPLHFLIFLAVHYLMMCSFCYISSSRMNENFWCVCAFAGVIFPSPLDPRLHKPFRYICSSTSRGHKGEGNTHFFSPISLFPLGVCVRVVIPYGSTLTPVSFHLFGFNVRASAGITQTGGGRSHTGVFLHSPYEVPVLIFIARRVWPSFFFPCRLSPIILK